MASVPLAGLLAGCPSPDVEGRYDGFVDKTQDDRDDAAMVKMDVGGTLADVTGTFHFSLTPTPVSATTPFQFIATTTFTAADGGGGQLDIDLQPLSLDILSTTEPREYVGDIISLSFPVDDAGAFDADIGEITLVGAANPVTGSDILATLQLTGAIQDEDVYCGIVGGMVTVPANIDLTGSTFAAIRINPDDAMNPDALGEPVGECPAGGGSGGGTDTDDGGSGGGDSTTG
jgi:hypothetical protein